MANDIPRRNRIDLYTPAESAIRAAMLAVEETGAHELLTEAVGLLGEAQNKVADFLELKPVKEPEKKKYYRAVVWGSTCNTYEERDFTLKELAETQHDVAGADELARDLLAAQEENKKLKGKLG